MRFLPSMWLIVVYFDSKGHRQESQPVSQAMALAITVALRNRGLQVVGARVAECV